MTLNLVETATTYKEGEIPQISAKEPITIVNGKYIFKLGHISITLRDNYGDRHEGVIETDCPVAIDTGHGFISTSNIRLRKSGDFLHHSIITEATEYPPKNYVLRECLITKTD